jgi:uncharacterized protein YqeY
MSEKMPIHTIVKNDIIEAMRAKDSLRLDTLRGLIALFTNEIIAKKMPASTERLDDESVTLIIRRAVKQRREAIEQYEKGGRKDLADKERSEITILEKYLEPQMPYDEIRRFVADKLIGVDKANGAKMIGMIMKELKGKADGAMVKSVVDEILKR